MKKIDWFYEHPEELNRLKDVYHESAANFALDKSVDALEQMFFDAIKDQKEGKDLHTLHPRRKDKRLLNRAKRAARRQEKKAAKASKK